MRIDCPDPERNTIRTSMTDPLGEQQQACSNPQSNS
jgi:hypothetical protein